MIGILSFSLLCAITCFTGPSEYTPEPTETTEAIAENLVETSNETETKEVLIFLEQTEIVEETTEEIVEESTVEVTEELSEETVETTEAEIDIGGNCNYEEPTPEVSSEAVDEPVAGETVSDIDEYDAELLAIAIYQEAGGDACCDACRRRVADIVLNRVADDRFPNTIEEVLTQESQYGRLHWTGVVWADRASNPNEAEAVERARRIAREVLEGNHSDVYGEGYIWQAGFIQGSDGFWCCGHWFGR